MRSHATAVAGWRSRAIHSGAGGRRSHSTADASWRRMKSMESSKDGGRHGSKAPLRRTYDWWAMGVHSFIVHTFQTHNPPAVGWHSGAITGTAYQSPHGFSSAADAAATGPGSAGNIV